jgi:DNA primase
MNGRICFPIYGKEGKIVGFSGRWFKEAPPEGVEKWKHLGAKRNFLFPLHLNTDIIRRVGEVIIVESIGDVLALWDAGFKNVFCVFGLSLSGPQILALLGLDIQRVIIATNNEESGRGNEAAIKIQKRLTKFFTSEKIIIALPNAKDFREMGAASIQQWYGALPARSE